MADSTSQLGRVTRRSARTPQTGVGQHAAGRFVQDPHPHRLEQFEGGVVDASDLVDGEQAVGGGALGLVTAVHGSLLIVYP